MFHAFKPVIDYGGKGRTCGVTRTEPPLVKSWMATQMSLILNKCANIFLKDLTQDGKKGNWPVVRWWGVISCFGTGTTSDDFTVQGNDPVVIDKLNSLVTTGAIVAAIALSMWAEMPCGLRCHLDHWLWWHQAMWEERKLLQYIGVAQDRHLGLLLLTEYHQEIRVVGSYWNFS